MSTIQVGDHVIAEYKTGVYIGELFEYTQGADKAVVKVLAVSRFPEQGNLHHPGQADVAMFHERPAMAKWEKARMPIDRIRPYKGPIPDYKDSLTAAFHAEKTRLQDIRDWADRALATMDLVDPEHQK